MGPSKSSETVAGFFLPAACREEVLGDLHERYQSPPQYAFDALCTVPLVVYSRIRRTCDPAVILLQAFLLYLCYLCAAWFLDRPLLNEQWGLLRLACPAAVALATLILVDVYAVRLARAAQVCCLAIGVAFVSQTILSYSTTEFIIPRWIMIYGSAAALLASTAVRAAFFHNQMRGVNAPAHWLERDAEPVTFTRSSKLLLFVGLVMAAAVIGIVLIERN